MSADTAEVDVETVETPRRSGLSTVLLAVIGVAVLVIAVAGGYLLGHRSSTSSSPSAVDVGFANDMSIHHQQAVTMAGYERDNSTNPTLKTLAFDIETSQQYQIGEMTGWLDSWGLVRTSQASMGWMGGAAHLESDGLMPGMATPTQLNTLLTLHGKALDVLFLQLMIHHHQGGVVMAHYVAVHASAPYVRALAQAMYVAQSSEIVQMEQALRQMGSAPLPAPK
jgi:uncharacterized protein (DUF305 family)